MNPGEALNGAVQWLDTNIDQFRLLNARSLEDRVSLMKPLADLAQAAVVLRDRGHLEKWCQEKARFCWDELQGGKKVFDLLMYGLTGGYELKPRPDIVAFCTVICACLGRFGLRSRDLDLILARAAKGAACASPEFRRRLDLAYGFEILELAPFPETTQVTSWSEGRAEPWSFDSYDSAYLMTHDIFYITAYGSRPRRLAGAIHSDIRASLPAWLALYSARGHWDISAELLMVAGCIGAAHEYTGAFSHLVAQQEPNGIFPGEASPRVMSQYEAAPETDKARTRFLGNYHTTLVSALALAYSADCQSSIDAVA